MTGSEKHTSSNGEGTLVLVLVLSSLGLMASIYLNHLHYKVHTDSSYSSICAVSEEVNCETVALSQYSMFLGLPVSYWGIAAHVLYILVSGLCLLDIRRHRAGPPRGWGILGAMAVGGVIASGVLFTISHFVIESLCPFCMAVYVLQAALVTTVGVHLTRRGENPVTALIRDLSGLLVKPALVIFAVPAIVLVCGYVVYPRIYGMDACPAETDEDLCSEHLTYGKPDARIRIVEYSDYQCPYCSMTHFALRKAVESWPDDVSLMHVQFPLDDSCNVLVTRPFHEHACEAARAAVCADRQDRFWDMNDWLFTHQRRIGNQPWGDIAGENGLDVQKFEACMADPASLDVVREDIEKASLTTFVKQGSVGTPIIFINDKGHMGGLEFEELEKYLVNTFDLPPAP